MRAEITLLRSIGDFPIPARQRSYGRIRTAPDGLQRGPVCKLGNEAVTTIVQQAGTGLYYSDSGKWSANEDEALRFRSSLAALQHLCDRNIRNAVLVLKFSNPEYDIHLHPFGEPRSQAKGV
jgi:hypothetical protein